MTDRAQVADALEEIGLLLDLLAENPFKSRAYANAARIVRGLDRDLDDLVRSGELREIRGLGPALTEKIVEILRAPESELTQRGAAGRRYALEHLTSAACLPRVLAILDRAAESGGRR